MDIDNQTFQQVLLKILHAISNAKIISIDLEMSGIALGRKQIKLDLQQYYEEVKSAAELYQVLQFGITCIEEDEDRELYLARPFNLYVSPLSLDSNNPLRIQRNVTFSSSACTFLVSNGFDFGKVFKAGVPYLSREEEALIRAEYVSRADNMAKTPDLVISDDDKATLEFMEDARNTISTWIKDPAENKFSFVNIGTVERPLNGYQRRLLFQLVRNEFPGFKIFSPRKDCGFMQVEEVIAAQQEARRKYSVELFNKRLAKQKGLSLIFEVLCGGDLSGIDPYWFYDRKSEDPEDQLDAITSKLEDIKEKLRNKESIIIGHNMFQDLAFIYKTFVGKLPEKVQHFQKEIHKLFPVVFDTKYISSYGANAMDPRGNLRDLWKPFQKIHTPLIVLHHEHTSYGSTINKEHEAGFDSWMTAELFIKLSSKLYEERIISNDDLQVEADPILSDSDDEARSDDNGVHDPNNPYSVLSLDDSQDDAARGPIDPTKWMPPLESEFWNVYVNKIQINAIEAGFCDLAESFDDSEEEHEIFYDCEE